VLKPYAVIDCPEQSIIADKVLNYLRSNTDLLDRKDLTLWNKVDTVALIKTVPELPKFYASLGLRLREVAVTVCNSFEDVGLHIDELPVTAKINFPILNTRHTYNEWYKVSTELLNSIDPIINEFGNAYYDLGSIDLAQCTKIAEIETLKPIVFNSQIPHKIRVTDRAEFPRIVLPCTFFNEPVHLL
jgi:hypothetical protein